MKEDRKYKEDTCFCSEMQTPFQGPHEHLRDFQSFARGHTVFILLFFVFSISMLSVLYWIYFFLTFLRLMFYVSYYEAKNQVFMNATLLSFNNYAIMFIEV